MLKFENLWKNYPDEDPCDAKDEKGKMLFSNQCAIRLSHAMKSSGVSFDSFPQKRKCWVHPGQDHILAAAELADWIEKSNIPNMLITENVTGAKWREKVVSRTGIICFEDYYLRTRFGIVIPSIWSDLGKSKKIRFFPVK